MALVAVMGGLALACSQADNHEGRLSSASGLLVAPPSGGAGASFLDGGTESGGSSSATGDGGTACHQLSNGLGDCRGSTPVRIGCTPGTPRPPGCENSREDYLTPGGLATWCCPNGGSLDGGEPSSQGPATPGGTCTGGCGEGNKCNCNGQLYVPESNADVLTAPKLYVDWWGWTNLSDPEIAAWEDFLENLGGSHWLETVTKYWGANGQSGNPNDLFVGGTSDEWFGSTNPLPASKFACTQDSDCTNINGQRCDLANGEDHCYCAFDTDCDSGHCCKPGDASCGASGLCVPTKDQLIAEAQNAKNNYFFSGNQGIILVALPSSIPTLNFMEHDDAYPYPNGEFPIIRAEHDGSVSTWLVEHEIAEAITNPWPDYQIGWVDPCGCEIGDMCNPPPSWSEIPQNMLVGESPTQDHQVESLWNNLAYNDSGGCVMSTDTHTDHYFTACGGHLRHYPSLAEGYTDDFGHPSGVLLSTDTQLAGVGAASWGYGRLDAFAVDVNGNVEHFYQKLDGTRHWESWGKPTGYTVQNSPDAFAPWPEMTQVAVSAYSGTTVHVFHKYKTRGYLSPVWQDWGAPPTTKAIISRPAVVSWNAATGDDRVDVFVVTSDYDIWHGYSTDGGATLPSGNWAPLGALPGDIATTRIDASSWGDQEFDVFVVGWSGDVWKKQYDHNNWTAWTELAMPSGTNFFYGVGAVGRGDTFFDLTGVPYTDTSNYFYDTSFGQWPSGSWIQDPSDVNVCSGVDIDSW